MRTFGTVLSVLALTLAMHATANVDEMREDGKKDQEDESGKLEDIYIPLPRLWLVARSQGRIRGGIGTVWWFWRLSRDGLGRDGQLRKARRLDVDRRLSRNQRSSRDGRLRRDLRLGGEQRFGRNSVSGKGGSQDQQ